MVVGHYRFIDDISELPQDKSVESVVKPQRQKFNVHCVRAVIEKMNEDSDSELADDDVLTKGTQDGAKNSGDSPVKKKQKLATDGVSHESAGSDNNEMEQEEEDVEQDDFISQVTAKLQTIASDVGIHDSENDDQGQQTRKKKLSLKKAGANSRVSRAAKCVGTSEKQKASAAKWSGEDVEDWDRIESLPDSDTDEPFDLESKPSGVRATKSPNTEAPKHRSATVSSDGDKRKQTSVHQLVKPSSRASKVWKYCLRDDMVDDSEEIAVEEDDSDVSDADFHSLTSGSTAAASEKGLASNKLTSSFWLASPASKKSVFNTDDDDDDDDDDDEFVSNSTLWRPFLLLSCVSDFQTLIYCLID